MLVGIRNEKGKRVPRMMKWGLIPHWAKDDKMVWKTFNARSETFATSPSFRDAWKWGQRCIVVTDGFYEWKKLEPEKAKGKKQAYAIAMADKNKMMTMAGLWSKWKNPANGEELLSCTVLTCEPNATMGAIHDRMPVVLSEDQWPRWLGEVPATNDELLAMLRPCPDDWITTWMVSDRVGNVRNNDPTLSMPV